MFLTIAICTFNRADFLIECVKSIEPQLENHDDVELVIINNNSNDDTENISKNFQKENDKVKYYFCKEQGLSHARNCALDNSTAQWLAFIDDDAYASNDWLENLLRLIHENSYDAFGGVYHPWFKDGKKSWFLESYESNASWVRVKDEGRLKEGYFSGGNSAFKTEWLRDIGGFRSNLGMTGNKVSYGEETHIQRVMALKGAKLGFSHRLVIYHYTPLKKQSIRWRWKRNYISGKLFWDIFEKNRNKKNLKTRVSNEFNRSIDRSIAALKKLHKKNGIKQATYELGCWFIIIGVIHGFFTSND